VSLGCPEYTLEEGPRWDGFDDARYELRVDFRRRGHCILWRRLIPAQSMVDLRALKSRNFSLGCFFPSLPASAFSPPPIRGKILHK
jgi:DHA2 family multidrug resistance protein